MSHARHVRRPLRSPRRLRLESAALGLLWALSAPARPSAQSIELSGPLARARTGAVVEAALTPDGGWVVYRADQVENDVFDLYGRPSDGSRPEVRLNPLLSEERSVSSFRLDPAGEHLTFLTALGRRLFRSTLDGAAAPVELVPGLPADRAIAEYQLSADGTRVAYTADQDVDERNELYVVASDGSAAPVRLSGTMVSGGGVLSPSIRIGPDGQRAFYLADQESDGVVELFEAPLAGGTAARKLNGALVAGGRVVDFLVSPDSRWIVYRAYQDDAETLELYGVPADGSGAAAKLNPTLVPGGDVGAVDQCFHLYCTDEDVIEEDAYKISADSRRVLYWADQEVRDRFDLYSAPIGGVRPKVRATPGVVRLSPDLGPGASIDDFQLDPVFPRVVFHIYSAGRSSLFASPLERRAPELLDGRDVYRFWIPPQGGLVVYYAADGHTPLHVVPSDGSGAPLDIEALPADAQVTLSADGTRILYRESTSYLDGERVLSVRLDGSDRKAIGLYRASQWGLQARGERVLYFDGNLHGARVDAEASEIQLNGELLPLGAVLGYVSSFQIAPDGRSAVYRAEQDTAGKAELYGVTLRTLERRKLNAPSALWSDVLPGGFQITSDGRRALYIADPNVAGHAELFSVPLDGSAAPSRISGTLIANGDVRTGLVSSPDGQWVVYRADAERAGRIELYAARADGLGGVHKLNERFLHSGGVPPNEPDPSRGLNVGFRISADGQWVVFRASAAGDGRIELFSVPLDGSRPMVRLNAALVPYHDDVQLDFQISSDSRRVVYRACQNANGSTQLYSAPIDGSAGSLELNGSLVSSEARVRSFLLTPDGTRALFVADGEISGDRHLELFSVPLDRSQAPVRLSRPTLAGGGVQPTVHPPGLPDSTDAGLRVSADGSRAVYLSNDAVSGVPCLYGALVDGSGEPVLLTPGLFVYRFALHGSFLAVEARNAGGGPHGLYSAPLDGSAVPRLLSAHRVGGFQLPTSGGQLFYTPYPADGRIFAVPIDGLGAPRQINEGVPFAVSMALDTTPDGTRVLFLPDPYPTSTGKSLFMSFLPRPVARF